ncbi:hypothetical protein BDR03DRAFT_923490 [Suillus americanus]|nr:hypothetical protein BDR03DRAFT_923490 [Suillus americanus]
MRLVLLCVFLYLVGVIQATPTTNTTNTTTSDSLKAPSFTTRTLWTIISNSILTVYACIYTAIHPNIPSPKDSTLNILRRRLWIMIVALFAPELIVSWTIRQWLSARLVTKQFKGYPNVGPQPEFHDYEENNTVEASSPLTFRSDHIFRRIPQLEYLDHEENNVVKAPAFRFFRADHIFRPVTFFHLLLLALAKGVSCMLAFLRCFLDTLAKWVKRSGKANSRKPPKDNTWTQTHSFFVLMGGFMLYVDEKPYCPLQPDHMLKLIREGCIDAPMLTANEINDKSKGNVISKGLVVLQVTWFVMQFITRIIYHLRITQLEVGTFIFAVFSFLTYAMWWNKPLDVRYSHPVYWKSRESRPEDHIIVPDPDELVQLGIWAPVLRPVIELLGFLIAVPASRKLRVRTLDGSVDHEDSDKVVLTCTVKLLETIFGVMHCMAWSFHFPTHQEQVLWRICAVGLTCGPFLFVVVLFILNALEISLASFIQVFVLCIMLYIAARATFLVLMFTTLRDLPHGSDVFDVVRWTSLVPHL